MGGENKFLLGAIFGAVVGVAATLIMAPVEGRIMRKKISSGLNETAKEIKRKAPKLNSEAINTTKNVLKKAAAKSSRKPGRTKLSSDSKKKTEDKTNASEST